MGEDRAELTAVEGARRSQCRYDRRRVRRVKPALGQRPSSLSGEASSGSKLKEHTGGSQRWVDSQGMWKEKRVLDRPPSKAAQVVAVPQVQLSKEPDSGQRGEVTLELRGVGF